jgi:hypothetical protein
MKMKDDSLRKIRKNTRGKPFENGNGGRPKGALNKNTKEIQQLFLSTIRNEEQYIAEAFRKVREENPARYLEIFAKYVQYVYPKKVEMIADRIEFNVIEIREDEPSQDD